METSDDQFLGGALTIRQPVRGYRAGIDAILLAAAAPIERGQGCRVLDVGAGAGTVGLAVARRIEDARVTLLEIDYVLAELATENARRNRLADRVTVIAADAAQGGALAQGASCIDGLSPGTFTHAVANPPYFTDGSGTPSPDPIKARSHQMAASDLDKWLRLIATTLVAGGWVTLVFRTDGLSSLLATIEPRFGGTELLPIHARAGDPATRCLVRARKGSRAPLTIRSGLVIHESPRADSHRFTPMVEAVLRHGAQLAW